MMVFNQKADKLLRFLNDNPESTWDIMFIATGIKKDDTVISFLKEKGFVFYSNNELRITVEGTDFVSKGLSGKQKNKKIKAVFL